MKNFAFWLRFSVFNFFIVSVLGVLMRYKIAFSLPILDQKHTQEAHSHFAFYGWITLAIYTFIMYILQEFLTEEKLKKYNTLLIINTISSWLMIPLFLWKGYFGGSIAVSTIVLVISYLFFYYLYKDFKGVQHVTKPWFLAAFLFALLSSFGVFFLAYMKISGNVTQDLYLASTYYYLHFQYNGFFTFACIGILIHYLQKIEVQISEKQNLQIFKLLFVGCVIGYGLSVLWLRIPIWIFVIIVTGTLLQTVGVFKLLKLVKENWSLIKAKTPSFVRIGILMAGFAFLVKSILQLGSNVPEISQFAFGFRNIVIAYLHLVLLMCISVFLLAQILNLRIFKISKAVIYSFGALLLGIFLNEAMLGTMGIFSIKYISIPNSAEILLGISVLMMVSLAILFLSLKQKNI